MTTPPSSQRQPSKEIADMSLSESFHQYFKVRVADTKDLRREAFTIRHRVYCKELNWEATRDCKLETDEYDNYSYHVLLEHIASNTFAGCVRIVIPPPHLPNTVTPFEAHCLSSIMPTRLNMNNYPKGSFGEVSRIAVAKTFRRRPNESDHPYITDGIADKHVFTKEERRHFPNIAIGLYLASVAMADICQHRAMFVMVEPRLSRHLRRVGLPFEQVGEIIEYHGTRALFRLSANDYSSALKKEVKELYDKIAASLRSQMTLLPYCDPTDR